VSANESELSTLPPEKEPEYVGAHSDADAAECRNWLEPHEDGDCGRPATHTVVMYHGGLSEIAMCDGCGEPEDVESWDRVWSADRDDPHPHAGGGSA